MNAAFLVIDKPAGITSHDVVRAVRAVTGIRKVGHTGTLDPFATGVLALALGGATRMIQYLDESMKVYDATITFGVATDTGDPTGQVVAEAPRPTADRAEVERVLRELCGDQMQRPPAYSAVKVKGKPLYYYARKGVEMEAQARPITIHDIELKEYDQQTARVIITCSRGTYARVLAVDIAEALGSTGHLTGLARLRSGPFFIEDALDMQGLADRVAAESGRSWQETLFSKGLERDARVAWRPKDEVLGSLLPYMRSPVQALSHLPIADLPPQEADMVRSGRNPTVVPRGVAAGGQFLVVCGDRVVAIAAHSVRGPKVVRVLDGGPEA